MRKDCVVAQQWLAIPHDQRNLDRFFELIYNNAK